MSNVSHKNVFMASYFYSLGNNAFGYGNTTFSTDLDKPSISAIRELEKRAREFHQAQAVSVINVFLVSEE